MFWYLLVIIANWGSPFDGDAGRVVSGRSLEGAHNS